MRIKNEGGPKPYHQSKGLLGHFGSQAEEKVVFMLVRIDLLLVIIQHIIPHKIMYTILNSKPLHATMSYTALFMYYNKFDVVSIYFNKAKLL